MDAIELAERVAKGDATAAVLIVQTLETLSKKLDSGFGLVLSRLLLAAKGEPFDHRTPWQQWAERALQGLSWQRSRERRSPWDTKAETWVKCLILRAKDQRYKGPPSHKGRFCFDTGSWESCAERMRVSAYASAWRNASSIWTKWANTVAKNINRRAEGRYGEV